MPKITLTNVTKQWGNFIGVNDLNLEIEDGAFVTLLGSSGCGKTTTLRMIAGLETPTRGEIRFDDKIMFSDEKNINVPAAKREVGFLFQNYALWPHMTVTQNIAFGLETLKWKKPEITERVKEMLKTLRIEQFADRYPAELHRDMGATFVYVTHDQLEAMTLSSKICLMNEGVLQQYAPPLTVYNRPSNLFVADFVGNPSMNIVDAKAQKIDAKSATIDVLGQRVTFRANEDFELPAGGVCLGIRPEFLYISDNGAFEGSAYSTLPAGMETTVKIKVGEEILSAVMFGAIDYETDAKLRYDITGDNILIFDRETTRCIASGSIAVG